MTNEPIGPNSTDAQLREVYNKGARVSTLMQLTGQDYETIKRRLVRVGANLRTGDRR